MVPLTISIQQIKQDMITADDVLSPSGHLIIPKDTPLNPRLISRLKLYNVKTVCVIIPDEVAEKLTAAAEKDKPLNPEKTTAEFKNFNRTYQDMAYDLEKACGQIINHPEEEFDVSSIVEPILALASTVKNTLHLMNTLQLMREYDDTIYIHSLSVALIAHTIATQQNLPEDQIRTLMLTCAFHDIGKLQIPMEIISKPGKLTEEEYAVIKTHPRKSYDILTRAHFPQEVCAAALLHHERCDGSGYPSGFKGERLPLFAKIIAIADVYDAMTARRSYRKEICSFDVIAEFEEGGYQKYDTTLLLPFLTGIAQSHINNQVRLSNSLIGTIVMLNQHKLSKPMVNVDGNFLDLSKEKNIRIVEML
ncbi:MAG: HD-GYP domain-containing protein [Lachnospiraceae bacterium]|nr:HD-GYP domain-containing protein [Lachnospiraceae bacterium]MBP3608780.1 HD-GYP domain-containing protein [Lachnospiraceae bacterium]